MCTICLLSFLWCATYWIRSCLIRLAYSFHFFLNVMVYSYLLMKMLALFRFFQVVSNFVYLTRRASICSLTCADMSTFRYHWWYLGQLFWLFLLLFFCSNVAALCLIPLIPLTNGTETSLSCMWCLNFDRLTSADKFFLFIVIRTSCLHESLVSMVMSLRNIICNCKFKWVSSYEFSFHLRQTLRFLSSFHVGVCFSRSCCYVCCFMSIPACFR